MNRHLLRAAALAAFAAVLLLAAAAPAARYDDDDDDDRGRPAATVRFSTFNASLNRNAAGELKADLLASTDMSRPGVVQGVLHFVNRPTVKASPIPRPLVILRPVREARATAKKSAPNPASTALSSIGSMPCSSAIRESARTSFGKQLPP